MTKQRKLTQQCALEIESPSVYFDTLSVFMRESHRAVKKTCINVHFKSWLDFPVTQEFWNSWGKLPL